MPGDLLGAMQATLARMQEEEIGWMIDASFLFDSAREPVPQALNDTGVAGSVEGPGGQATSRGREPQ